MIPKLVNEGMVMKDKNKLQTISSKLTHTSVNLIYFFRASIWLLTCVLSPLSVTWACGVNAHLWITDSAICQLPVGSILRQFYSIQNAVGENMNLNRSRALMAAKADLSGKIKTIMGNLANQELEFTNGNERESFDQKSTTVSNLSMAKIMLKEKVWKTRLLI